MGYVKHVTLSEGMFRTSQETGKQYILSLEPDRLLAPCREAMGQKPKAERYGGWEQREIAGHSLGHWLSAASYMYRADGDDALLKGVRYIVDELAGMQDERGYVGGVKRSVFDALTNGDFSVERFSLNGVWVPWYSVHKLYQGLIDAYVQAGVGEALAVVTGMTDWAVNLLSCLSDEQMKRMMFCEHGGMNDVFAQMYEITGKDAYRNAAIRFTDDSVLEPLGRECDELEGLHANTQLPKIIGAKRIGTEEYRRAAKFFFDTVTRERSYVIGGNSNCEHFEKPGAETLGVQTCETCNTYNMLKLAAQLFDAEHNSRYMDYYEAALYNHILASQDPDSGMKSYFMATEPGHFKVYCTPYDSFWCCTGTGMENPARYGLHIYYEDEDALYVNLFIPSVLEYRGMKISQTTCFPNAPFSKLTIEEGEGTFTLKIRVPEWNMGEMAVGMNGKQIQKPAENGHIRLITEFEELYRQEEKGYIEIKRHFKKGDTIDIGLHMGVTVRPKKDDPHRVSFFYGPIVLASMLGNQSFPETDIQAEHTALDAYPRIDAAPIITKQKDLLSLVTLYDWDTLTFSVTSDDGEQQWMRPYYSIHHQRYNLYLGVYTPKEYEELQKRQKQAEQEKESVIDCVRPGEQQSEIDHHLRGNQMQAGYLSAASSAYRYAYGGDGYIEYTLTVSGAKEIRITYWGSDDDFSMYADTYWREFDILFDGEQIGQCSLHSERPNELFTVGYPLKKSRKGKGVLRLQTRGEKTCAGGVYRIEVI